MGYFAGSEDEEFGNTLSERKTSIRKSNEGKTGALPGNTESVTASLAANIQTSRIVSPRTANSKSTKSTNLEANIHRIWSNVTMRENVESGKNLKETGTQKLLEDDEESNIVKESNDIVNGSIIKVTDFEVNRQKSTFVTENSDSKTLTEATEISNMGCQNIEWTTLALEEADTRSNTLTKHAEPKDLDTSQNSHISMIVVSGDSESNIFEDATEISNMGCVNIEWTQLERDDQISNTALSEKHSISNSCLCIADRSETPLFVSEKPNAALKNLDGQILEIVNKNAELIVFEKNTQTETQQITTVPGIIKVIDLLDYSQTSNTVGNNKNYREMTKLKKNHQIPTIATDENSEIITLEDGNSQLSDIVTKNPEPTNRSENSQTLEYLLESTNHDKRNQEYSNISNIIVTNNNLDLKIQKLDNEEETEHLLKSRNVFVRRKKMATEQEPEKNQVTSVEVNMTEKEEKESEKPESKKGKKRKMKKKEKRRREEKIEKEIDKMEIEKPSEKSMKEKGQDHLEKENIVYDLVEQTEIEDSEKIENSNLEITKKMHNSSVEKKDASVIDDTKNVEKQSEKTVPEKKKKQNHGQKVEENASWAGMTNIRIVKGSRDSGSIQMKKLSHQNVGDNDIGIEKAEEKNQNLSQSKTEEMRKSANNKSRDIDQLIVPQTNPCSKHTKVKKKKKKKKRNDRKAKDELRNDEQLINSAEANANNEIERTKTKKIGRRGGHDDLSVEELLITPGSENTKLKKIMTTRKEDEVIKNDLLMMMALIPLENHFFEKKILNLDNDNATHISSNEEDEVGNLFNNTTLLSKHKKKKKKGVKKTKKTKRKTTRDEKEIDSSDRGENVRREKMRKDNNAEILESNSFGKKEHVTITPSKSIDKREVEETPLNEIERPVGALSPYSQQKRETKLPDVLESLDEKVGELVTPRKNSRKEINFVIASSQPEREHVKERRQTNKSSNVNEEFGTTYSEGRIEKKTKQKGNESNKIENTELIVSDSESIALSLQHKNREMNTTRKIEDSNMSVNHISSQHIKKKKKKKKKKRKETDSYMLDTVPNSQYNGDAEGKETESIVDNATSILTSKSEKKKSERAKEVQSNGDSCSSLNRKRKQRSYYEADSNRNEKNTKKKRRGTDSIVDNELNILPSPSRKKEEKAERSDQLKPNREIFLQTKKIEKRLDEIELNNENFVTPSSQKNGKKKKKNRKGSDRNVSKSSIIYSQTKEREETESEQEDFITHSLPKKKKAKTNEEFNLHVNEDSVTLSSKGKQKWRRKKKRKNEEESNENEEESNENEECLYPFPQMKGKKKEGKNENVSCMDEEFSISLSQSSKKKRRESDTNESEESTVNSRSKTEEFSHQQQDRIKKKKRKSNTSPMVIAILQFLKVSFKNLTRHAICFIFFHQFIIGAFFENFIPFLHAFKAVLHLRILTRIRQEFSLHLSFFNHSSIILLST